MSQVQVSGTRFLSVCSKERILVKIKFESRLVLMSKRHDSLLFMVLYREALDRLCVRLNMYLVRNVITSLHSDDVIVTSSKRCYHVP